MYSITKRIFDILSAIIVLVLLIPVFVILSIWILLDSKGGVFYSRIRVGKNGKLFKLHKFRSMRQNAEASGQLTIGNDNRVTKSGKFIRKTKLDEFPQLINIIKGEMSIVGPRPEVPRYVDLYTPDQRRVLSVKPGLTDLASLEFISEQEILGKSNNPEKVYIEEIMPKKLELNLRYIDTMNFWLDIKLIFNTIRKIV